MLTCNRGHARTYSFFLHPDLRDHPTGLSCVIPLMNVVPALRSKGAKIVWVYVSQTSSPLSAFTW